MIKHARFVILYRNLTDDGATAAFPSPHKAHSIFISHIYRTRQKLVYGRQGLAGGGGGGGDAIDPPDDHVQETSPSG